MCLFKSHFYFFITAPIRYLITLKLAWATRNKGLVGTIYQLFYFLEAGILAYQIQRRQIQHLHNHNPASSGNVAMLASQLGGFTFSFTIHGPSIFFEPYRWQLSEKIKRALFVVCISHFCRSQCMYFASPDDWQKMSIVHCGIDTSLFSAVSHKSFAHKLLYVGRLAPEKGVPILFVCLSKLKKTFPDISLTIVGDGKYRAQLEKLSVDLQLEQQVEFVGYKSQAEVKAYLQNTDIFVLPSFAEGIPVVLMEAMASGVPVVTTQIAGVAELVDNGISGYLVPPGDVDSFCDRLESLFLNPQTRINFAQVARKKVETDFNLDLETERLYDLFCDYIT